MLIVYTMSSHYGSVDLPACQPANCGCHFLRRRSLEKSADATGTVRKRKLNTGALRKAELVTGLARALRDRCAKTTLIRAACANSRLILEPCAKTCELRALPNHSGSSFPQEKRVNHHNPGSCGASRTTPVEKHPHRLSFCQRHPYLTHFSARHQYRGLSDAIRPYRSRYSATRPNRMLICPQPPAVAGLRTRQPRPSRTFHSGEMHSRKQARSQNSAARNRPAVKLMPQPHTHLTSNDPRNGVHVLRVENLRRRHRHRRYPGQAQRVASNRIGAKCRARRMVGPTVVLYRKSRSCPVQIGRNGFITTSPGSTRNRQRHIQTRPRKPVATQPNRQTQQQRQTRLHGRPGPVDKERQQAAQARHPRTPGEPRARANKLALRGERLLSAQQLAVRSRRIGTAQLVEKYKQVERVVNRTGAGTPPFRGRVRFPARETHAAFQTRSLGFQSRRELHGRQLGAGKEYVAMRSAQPLRGHRTAYRMRAHTFCCVGLGARRQHDMERITRSRHNPRARSRIRQLLGIMHEPHVISLRGPYEHSARPCHCSQAVNCRLVRKYHRIHCYRLSIDATHYFVWAIINKAVFAPETFPQPLSWENIALWTMQ